MSAIPKRNPRMPSNGRDEEAMALIRSVLASAIEHEESEAGGAA
jgi:hypothetical protein